MSRYTNPTLEAVFPRFANFTSLGQGGEGAVFAVWDRIRKADLALKLMRDTGGSDLARRFDHEHGILALARSERLVRVYDHGMVSIPVPGGGAADHYWYTMERCQSSARSTLGRMSLVERVGVGMQMIDGLAFLHAKGIAHRDIKPDNIFLLAGMQVKIGDFGLATPNQALVAEETIALGTIAGSPPYLAPERWVGLQDADWRPSDQYAAGVTIYELLSGGRAPLDFGETLESCFRAHLGGRIYPLRVPELGAKPLPSVDRVLARMLAKQPEGRYRELAECKLELSAALALDGV